MWTCVWTVVFPGVVLTSSTVLLCASLDANECFEFLWSGVCNTATGTHVCTYKNSGLNFDTGWNSKPA